MGHGLPGGIADAGQQVGQDRGSRKLSLVWPMALSQDRPPSCSWHQAIGWSVLIPPPV